MSANHTAWPEAQTEILRKLFASGLSFSVMAAEMGLTRNAVIGRAHRIGLNGRIYTKTRRSPEEIEAMKRRKNERRNLRRKIQRINAVKIPPPIVCEAVGSRHLTLLELGRNDCRWPYGDGPFTFCGASKYEGSSYCPNHLIQSKRNGRD